VWHRHADIIDHCARQRTTPTRRPTYRRRPPTSTRSTLRPLLGRADRLPAQYADEYYATLVEDGDGSRFEVAYIPRPLAGGERPRRPRNAA
jgi:hypothetical protein